MVGKNLVGEVPKHGQKMLGTKKKHFGMGKPIILLVLFKLFFEKENVEGEFQEIFHVSSRVPEGRSGCSIDSPNSVGGTSGTIFVGLH